MNTSGLSLRDVWQSSPAIMTILFTCSLLMMATFLERLWSFWREGNPENGLWRSVKRSLLSKDMKTATQEAKKSHSLLGRALMEVLEVVAVKQNVWEEGAEDIWHLRRDETIEALRRRLVIFGTLSFITPLLGLMGSVLGIHHAFHDIALTGNGGANVVASGISEALLSTLVGVIVAVPALIFYNGFSAALASRVSQWDRIGQELFMIIGSWQRSPADPEKKAK